MILNVFYFSVTLYPKVKISKLDNKESIIEKNLIENSNFKKNLIFIFF